MPVKTLSEADFMTALRQHQRIGAELLYNRYAGILHKVIFCTVKDLVMADEVLADTFLAGWTSTEDFFEQDRRLLIWLSGIARGLAKEKLKATAAFQPLGVKRRKQIKQIYNPGPDDLQIALQ